MPNYPVPYQSNWGYSGAVGQQVYPQYTGQNLSGVQVPQIPQVQQNQQSGMGLQWVDGEIGAKAFQLPAGWPPNYPIALWDTNDTVIYLKSVNPMGMPNPLQRARYRLEDANSGEKTQGYSGDTEPKHDMSDYVRKEDLEKVKHDLMDAMNSTVPARRTAKGDA